ncbi:MAG: amino acid ABC transporter permease [Candidatus Izemoplasmatales bacterium]|nr:amino acid ABC transporter permease [Candidatus Izemoplasmatales bacterium]
MDYLIQTAEYLLGGAWVSTKIFFVTLAFSFPLGIAIAVAARTKWTLLTKFIRFYTWLFRGTPLMLQLFFFMYGLPAIGIMVDRMMVAYVGFVLNYAAYFTEILRAGIESTPKDQFEASAVEGARFLQTYRFVVLPQAIRKELPTITNEVITLIKDTALVTVIAISDILRNVKEVVSRDFTVSPFFLAAAFYLTFSFVIVSILRKTEKKYDFLDA